MTTSLDANPTSQSEGIIARIDLKAVGHNFALASALADSSDIIPVVKANAYGHGAVAVAQHLSRCGAEYFAVARLSEALQLRGAGLKQPLLIMSEPIERQLLERHQGDHFIWTVHNQSSLEQVLSYLEGATELACLRVFIKFDSGMHRLGLSAEQALHAAKRLGRYPQCETLVLMSHFASADDKDQGFLEHQLEQIKQVCKQWNKLKINYHTSLANSAALLRNQKYVGDYARPGIMLYGANPLFDKAHLCRANKGDFKPTLSLSAPIIALREIQSGESVGYNRCWHAGRTSQIATIGIGYADGYPRHAANGTPVYINGQYAPLVGRVSMDMIGVDITDIGPVQVGDRAELWGKHLDINHVAKAANTISYDLLTGIGGRTKRIFAKL